MTIENATPKSSAKTLNARPALQVASGDRHPLRSTRILLWTFSAFILVFFVWSHYFSIDQIVHAQGQVIASSHTQVVQVADGGVLKALNVQEGDEVKTGQIIASLSKERAVAAYNESMGKVIALRMNVSRLQAEVNETPLVFSKEMYRAYPDLVESQLNLYKQRRHGIESQMQGLVINVELAEKELEMNLPLEAKGDISKADILRMRRAVNDAQNQLMAVKSKYLQDASTELNKAQEDLNAQEQGLADRGRVLEHTDIAAPTNGVVKNVRTTTIGAVLRQGDEILQILPTESALVLEVKLKPSDMNSIEVGLPVKIKFDAYDYAIFGSMNGKVIYVSADSLTEDTKMGPSAYYRVKIEISEPENQTAKSKHIPIRPGMTATVDIQTGKRSVLSYLSKPLTKTVNDSMGEK